jgi:hypothetical protein
MIANLFRPFRLTNQQREHRGQQHKNHGLNKAHQHFQEVEWNRQQPPQARNQPGHGLQHVLTRKGVAVETKTQGNRPEQD